ncbi:MAG: flippase-like domain-containing protein [Bacilli bacterium]|nr:flippase-like domain-containing protein [Bacilli bacterium]
MSRIQVAKPKKKKSNRKYVLYFALVLGLTLFSLLFSFYSAGDGHIAAGFRTIVEAIVGTDKAYLFVIVAVLIAMYVFQGIIILVFGRLYTRHYHLHQGVANALIGTFYNNVTPGATGGQVMQVYTMKKQGIEISNAASIMVMWFILYQFSLIIYDVLALAFEWNTIMSIKSITIPGFSIGGWNGELPMLPLIIAGFAFNLFVIMLLFTMSYSRHIHNFVMHYGIGIGAKLKLIKNPDRTRENLRVQVENFKIELRRLQSNIPVTVLILILFFVVLTLQYSIPYFSGLALNSFGYGYTFNIRDMFDFCFRSAFQQMSASLVPLPGNAGVSELIFTAMFNSLYVETISFTDVGLTVVRSASANVMAAQIIWRFSTYHIVLLISGLVSALYHSNVEDNFKYANRQTFVDLQLSTYDERRTSSDTMYETKQLSRKEVREFIRGGSGPKLGTWAIDTGDDFLGPLPQKMKKPSRELTVDDLGDD